MKTLNLRTAPVLMAVLALALTACTSTPAPVSAPAPKPAVVAPDVISLPNGFQPEGIAGTGNTIYVGSIPTGAVYRADVTTGKGDVLVPGQSGRAAIGLKVDGNNRLIVCGGSTGKVFVYDATTGGNLADYTLSETTQTFINDVAVTDDAAWFTDSQKSVIYRLALPADGSQSGPDAVTTLRLTGDFKLRSGAFNLNGIAWTGKRLIAVQSGAGLLFSIDPATGKTRRIDIGAERVKNGDGLLLDGHTLFVVQNRDNTVAVIDLSADFTSGTVRTRLTNPDFAVPTTLAAIESNVYAVNARFGVNATPDTTYTVVRFDRP